jgi:hypothetical protein
MCWKERVALMLFAVSALVPSGTQSLAQGTKRIDTRTVTEIFEDKTEGELIDRHWVIFAANPVGQPPTIYGGKPSYTGHIFVIFGVESKELQSSSLEAYSFYPAGDEDSSIAVNSILSSVPGSVYDNLDGIHEGTWKPNETQMFVVEVPKEDYDRARTEVAIEYKQPPPHSKFLRYSIPNSDCVTFADMVAGAIGLKRPTTLQLPTDYLKGLEGLNSSGLPDPSNYKFTSPPLILYSHSIPPVQVIYTGQTDLGGVPSGKGAIHYQNGVSITGNWTSGYPDGDATFSYPDGHTITSTYKDGNPTNLVLHDGTGAHDLTMDSHGNFSQVNSAANQGGGVGSGTHGTPDHEHDRIPDDHWSMDGRDMGVAKCCD